MGGELKSYQCGRMKDCLKRDVFHAFLKVNIRTIFRNSKMNMNNILIKLLSNIWNIKMIVLSIKFNASKKSIKFKAKVF